MVNNTILVNLHPGVRILMRSARMFTSAPGDSATVIEFLLRCLIDLQLVRIYTCFSS